MNKIDIKTYMEKLFFFFLLSFLAIFFYGCNSLPAEYKNVSPTGNQIMISVSEVNDGKVHFYTYRKTGKRINFFIRTDGKGDLSAYFDACFTCYKKKKGYRSEGTDLICNECSMKFRLADVKWDNSQGCSPILIKSYTDKGQMIIMTENIEKGGRLF